MSTCNLTNAISGTECIGASREKINNNFASLESVVCDLSAQTIQVQDTTSVDLTFNPISRLLTAGVLPGVIHDQAEVTETTTTDELLLWRSSGDLKRITVGNALAYGYFKSTESYPISSTDNEMKVTSVYVNNTGNPTANGTTLTQNPTNIWRRVNRVEQNYGNFAQVKKIGGSDNATYIELSAGFYEIRAEATMYACETHCAALLSFDPTSGSPTYTTIAEGSVQYSEWDGNPDSSTSRIVGRFNFASPVGIALFHAFSSRSSGQNPVLGARNFRHIMNPVPAWLQGIIPRAPTAQIEIIKLS